MSNPPPPGLVQGEMAGWLAGWLVAGWLAGSTVGRMDNVGYQTLYFIIAQKYQRDRQRD